MYYKPFDVPLKEYEGLICRREYWDGLGTEWGWSSVEEKIIRLAGFVQQGGNLKKIINRYAKDRDETYRREIQHCILEYILVLMAGDCIKIYRNSPFVERIKRLDKEELVKLLSDQLKTSVRRICYMEGGGIKEGWEIRYDNPLTPDEYMDKVDRKHFRKYPNESFTTFLDRYKLWDSPTFSLW